MKPSLIVKHSVVLHGHKTSVSIEKRFWDGLKRIAARDGVGLNYLVSEIDHNREHDNLSSAIRLFVLDDAERRAVPLMPAAALEMKDEMRVG